MKFESRPFEEIFPKESSEKLLVVYCGGSALLSEYTVLRNLMAPFGLKTLWLQPGRDTGIAVFISKEQAEKFMESVEQRSPADNVIRPGVEFIKFGETTRSVFYFYTHLTIRDINESAPNRIPNASLKASIPGLELIPEILSPEEEASLLEVIDKQPWARLSNRRVQHYGYEFIYGLNSVNKNKFTGELPDWVQFLVFRLNQRYGAINNGGFDQLTINNYEPGDGIPPHTDTHSPFEEALVSVSLGSGAVMTYKRFSGEESHLFLPILSAMVMTGEARYGWTHAIASRKLDLVEDQPIYRGRRVSLTFRKIRRDPCTCKFPVFCDSQGYDSEKEMKSKLESRPVDLSQRLVREREIVYASESEIKLIKELRGSEGGTEETKEEKRGPSELEKAFVYEVYDKIASHFSETRYNPWPRVAKFLKGLPDYSIVADVGCGNGKYLGVNERLIMVGTDRSKNLLEIAVDKNKGAQAFVADSLKLPLRSSSVDHTISIAVIHHFSSEDLRLKAISELQRITRLGGQILIYVWAFEQEERKFVQQDVFVPWNLQNKYDGPKPSENQPKFSKIESEEEKEVSLEKEEPLIEKETLSKNPEIPKEEKPTKTEEIVNSSEFKTVDLNKKATVYKRYYHLFKQGELEELVTKQGNLEVFDSFYDHANWCVVAKKIKE